jgi:type IV secretion system protein VirB8
MLFNKKSVKDKDKSPQQLANEFISAASAFEKSRVDQAYSSRRVAWMVAAVSCFITVLAVGAVTVLTPLKRVEPYVVRVDNKTGETTIVNVLSDAETSYGDVIDRYWLAQYVMNREGYDWNTLKTSYGVALLLSNPNQKAEVKKKFSGNEAPQKLYGKNNRLEVKIKGIEFLGNTAQIRFSVYTKGYSQDLEDLNKEDVKQTKWIATIAYRYENAPATDAERLINPLGFKVNTYRLDPEEMVSN